MKNNTFNAAWSRRLVAIAFFALLFWVWPNIIHEPLHVAALKLQGLDGTINFDWGWPAAPTTTRLGELQGVVGGLFYLLLPSVVSMILLYVIWRSRRNAGLLTHIVLPTYLAFDLLMNVLSYKSPVSDFRFLSLLPGSAVITIAVLIAFSGIIIVLGGFAHHYHKDLGWWNDD